MKKLLVTELDFVQKTDLFDKQEFGDDDLAMPTINCKQTVSHQLSAITHQWSALAMLNKDHVDHTCCYIDRRPHHLASSITIFTMAITMVSNTGVKNRHGRGQRNTKYFEKFIF